MGLGKPNFLVQNARKVSRQGLDFYATHPSAVESLLRVESFSPTVWECCVGQGHIANVLKENGYNVLCSDIVDRGYPDTIVKNVFDYTENSVDVVTNPPYNVSNNIIEHLLDISENKVKVAMLLKLTFLEG